MKFISKPIYGVLALILIAFLAFGYFWGRGEIGNRVLDQIQSQINSRQDGSNIHWETSKVEGKSLHLQMVAFFDGASNWTLEAQNISISPNSTKRFNIDVSNAEFSHPSGKVINAEKLSLKNLLFAQNSNAFNFESADFQNLKLLNAKGDQWNVKQGTLGTFIDAHLEEALLSEISFERPSTHLRLELDQTKITKLQLTKEAQSSTFLGFSYQDFHAPFNLYWFNENIASGEFDSKDNHYSEFGAHILGETLINADLKLSDQQLTDNLHALDVSEKEISRLLKELKLNEIVGTINAQSLYENARLDLDFESVVLGAGKLTAKARLTSHNPEVTMPENVHIEDLRFHKAEIDYVDDALLDALVEVYRIDPVIFGFLAQMALPNYLPQDPKLVQEISKTLGEITRNKSGFSVRLNTRVPLSLDEVLLIWEEQRPLSQSFQIEFQAD